jgi:hypothetical protein
MDEWRQRPTVDPRSSMKPNVPSGVSIDLRGFPMQHVQSKWPTTFEPSGFRFAYRFDVPNYCPACGGSNWLVGRNSAQCAFCSTAVPFANHRHAHAA